MIRKIGKLAMLAVVCCAVGAAAQVHKQVKSLMLMPDTRPEHLTHTYMTVKKTDDLVRVGWVQALPATPKNAEVYYSGSPQGGDISKYSVVRVKEEDNDEWSPGGAVQAKGISFRPDSNGIEPGVYYCMVAFNDTLKTPLGDNITTYHSDEFQLMVASPTAPSIMRPKAQIPTGTVEIEDLTPVFEWEPVPGVPYYHVIMSDEPLPIKDVMDGDLDNVMLNFNIVWQVITPASRIRYGVPDPSGTITASPPPLSPGKEYSWMVLNNYGNHLAFTDGNAWGLPATFRIKGEPITPPKVVSPVNDVDLSGSEKIEFKWTNLDTLANSYLINLFLYTDAEKLGVGDLDSLNGATASAAMLVWEKTVSMPKGLTSNDFLTAEIPNPASTLTGGDYMWRVYARESNGAASTDKSSVGVFHYAGVPTGEVYVKTMEMAGEAEANVGFVELRVEVINGPMQAPLALYTNHEGWLERELSAGTYRVTAVKDGYIPSVVTFTVVAGQQKPPTTKIQMRRPDATIFGRVVDEDGEPVNLATVTAISGNDTVTAHTGGNGYFTINCKEASWTVTVEKAGYKSPRFRSVTVDMGQSFDFGTTTLEKNPFMLSGTVRNSRNVPVLGAQVSVFRDGVLIDRLPSTPQNGSFSFALPTGSYTLTAEMAGFAMFSRDITFTGTTSIDVTLAENAAIVNGFIIGKSWNPSTDGYDIAPIPNARVTFFDDRDTLTVTSDATFGNFSLSVPGGRTFTVRSEANGFFRDTTVVLKTITTDGGTTHSFDKDTLIALARISGVVRATGDNNSIGDVDVSVFDNVARRNVATAKSPANGIFELRNIPDGNYVINAGKSGYFLNTPIGLTVSEGKSTFDNGMTENNLVLMMDEAEKSITWNIIGYNGNGLVRVSSPLTRSMRFTADAVGTPSVTLDSVGSGDYVIEAVAEDDPTLLRLAYRKFRVDPAAANIVSDTVYFQYIHTPQDNVSLNTSGRVSFSLTRVLDVRDVSADSLRIFYRSEGTSHYKDTIIRKTGNILSLSPLLISPDRDGCDFYYYFRVYMSNGDVYGSDAQVFSTYVQPTPTSISRLSVNPGASGDTLRLTSSYAAEFTLSAFYGDSYIPIDTTANIGNITWNVYRNSGATNGGTSVRSNGRRATLTTGSGKDTLTLIVALQQTAATSYVARPGRDTVKIPVIVTGKKLERLVVRRNGEEGAISNTEKAGFRVNGYDEDDMPVTVSPEWTLTPRTAGTMVNGEFTPAPGFFGTVGIVASAAGEGAAYHETGAEFPGLRVNYVLRSRGGNQRDTADTKRGFKISFPPNSLTEGANQSLEIRAGIRSEAKNSVYRGGSGVRMADSLSYDLEFVRMDNLRDTTNVEIVIDIPDGLKSDASKNPENFKIARWYPDSLRWIELPSSEVVGGVIVAKLNKNANDLINNANMAKVASSSVGKKSARSKKSVAKTAATAAPASELHAAARYAVVTKSDKLALNVSISPNPFSPYIKPVKEYAKDYGRAVPAGTCIKVHIEALDDQHIRSVKVHIFNSKGQRVWAVNNYSAHVGENRIWWDGRTTSREEMWAQDFNERNKSKGKMLRNGRYFVTVIMTDIEGREKRVMKPVVLMK